MEYTSKNIVSLSPGRAFREKLGMYLSADKQEAINLGLRELIVNVQDEYEVYKPQNPILLIKLDTNTHTICVEDNMRGIPVGTRDDGINSLTAAFLIPHSGGKHSEGAYSSAVGINGEGVKVVCHTAKWLKVTVRRDNCIYTQSFESDEEGAHAITDVIAQQVTKLDSTGTCIEYMPDPDVYGDVFIDLSKLRNMLKEISMFTIGLRIVLAVDDKEEVFLSDNGLIDGLDGNNALSKPFSYFYQTEDCKVELALQWVSKQGTIRGYANGLYMPDGGAFITGFKTSLTKTFNSLCNGNFSGEQIRACLTGVISVKVRVGQFSNQAKTALANPEARTAASTAITKALKHFVDTRRTDFDKVIELMNKVAKAELAAGNARKKVMEATKDIERNQKKKVFASDKLKDAEFLGQNSVLLLVEGDSAAASIAVARDIKKYGILALKGKMINCLANKDEDTLENDEIRLLLSAMNIIPGKYDSSKLRYGKIGICTDSDSDGYHIGLLIMAALYHFAPKFIEEGRLCWLRSPLYIVKSGNTETYYYTDEDMTAARGKVRGEIQRNKGLGSLSADQAKRSMFDPSCQRLDVMKHDVESKMLLEELMGEDVEPRRKFIFNNIDFSTIHE